MPALHLVLATALGLFSSSADIGEAQVPGNAFFDAATRSYQLRAPLATARAAVTSGRSDLIRFVSKQAEGDLTLAASLRVDSGWASVMVRDGIDADAPFCAISVDAVGNTKLRYRPGKGVKADEFAVAWRSPKHIAIQRRGNEFSVMADDGTPRPKAAINGPVIVSMSGQAYAGVSCGSEADGKAGSVIFNDVKFSK